MKIFHIKILLLVLFISACQPVEGTAEPAASEIPQTESVISPTPTLATLPTPTPTEPSTVDLLQIQTETAAPADPSIPTAVPQYDLIQAGNLDDLSLSEIIPLQAKMLGEKDNPWKAARWTENNAYIIVETSLGIDVLDGGSLEYIRSYAGLKPLSYISNSSLLAASGVGLVELNYQTGESSSLGFADLPGSNGWPVTAASSDGLWLAYGTGVNSADVVEISTGAVNTIVLDRPVAVESIEKLLFSLDGTVLFITCTDRLNKQLTFGVNLAAKEIVFEISADGLIALSPDAEHFAFEDLTRTLTHGLTARQHDGLIQSQIGTMGSGSPAVGQSYSYRVMDMAYLADGQTLAVLYNGYQKKDDALEPYSPYQLLLTWDAETGGLLDTYLDVGVLPQTISIAPDGQRFLLSTPDGVLRIYSLSDGRLLAESSAYDASSNRVLSPDGKLVAYMNGGDVEVIQTSDYEAISSFNLQESFPTEISMRFIDGDLLGVSVVSAHHFRPQDDGWGAKAYTVIMSIEAGEELQRLDDAGSCIFSANGLYAACEHSGTITGDVLIMKVFDLQSGLVLHNFTWLGEGYYAFDPLDDNLVHCITNDNLYSITNTSTGGLSYYHYPCEPFAFDPTGTEILFADGSVMWKMTDKVIRSLVLPAGINRNQAPQFFFESTGDFVVMNNGAFSFAVGGAAAVFDCVEAAYSAALSEDGEILMLLTDRGLEYWRVME